MGLRLVCAISTIIALVTASSVGFPVNGTVVAENQEKPSTNGALPPNQVVPQQVFNFYNSTPTFTFVCHGQGQQEQAFHRPSCRNPLESSSHGRSTYEGVPPYGIYLPPHSNPNTENLLSPDLQSFALPLPKESNAVTHLENPHSGKYGDGVSHSSAHSESPMQLTNNANHMEGSLHSSFNVTDSNANATEDIVVYESTTAEPLSNSI